MKHYAFFMLLLGSCLLVSCKSTDDAQLARERVNDAYLLVNNGNLNGAKIQLDSVHLLYPKQVEARRAAKDLQDSIVYIEAQRSLAYADSMLAQLLPQVDEQIKKFKWEKQDKYEDKGRYVHRLLDTDRNTSRCFLQCYVDEGKGVTLKSYYFGSKKIEQEQLALVSADNELRKSGSNYSFEAEGWHEILTFSEQDALDLLQFVSAYKQGRIKVELRGKGNYSYILQESEKNALEETYRLAVLLKDVQQLERQESLANLQINNYVEKHTK